MARIFHTRDVSFALVTWNIRAHVGLYWCEFNMRDVWNLLCFFHPLYTKTTQMTRGYACAMGKGFVLITHGMHGHLARFECLLGEKYVPFCREMYIISRQNQFQKCANITRRCSFYRKTARIVHRFDAILARHVNFAWLSCQIRTASTKTVRFSHRFDAILYM